MGVRDAGQHLKELHISVAAISPDGVAAQKKFDENNNLGFPLLSDTEHTASEAYGVWEEKSMYGKTYWGIVRSAFLIDEHGVIFDAWYKIKPEETVFRALEALSAEQDGA
jgi:thioredoxin-dependent peroxiredoxin